MSLEVIFATLSGLSVVRLSECLILGRGRVGMDTRKTAGFYVARSSSPPLFRVLVLVCATAITSLE